MKTMFAGAIASVLLCACTPPQVAQMQAVEAKVAPVVADACAKFRAAESKPAVQLAIAAGTMVANAESGAAAGPVIAAIKSYGDVFCANGPPAGDATTPDQQAAWLNQKVTGQLVALIK